MPIYVYHCPKCDRDDEVILRIMENPPITCEVCGSDMKQKFVPTRALHVPFGFTVTQEKNPKWVDAKLDRFKEHPEEDPYLKHRDKK